MIAVLMVDGEEQMRVVNKPGLEMLGLTVDQAFDRALKNLRARVGHVEIGKELGVEFAYANSGLATGTLLYADACAAKGPEKYVLVPDRNTYVSVLVSDKAAAEAFWRLAKGLIASGESASRSVLLCRSGRWTVASPPR
jgi:hypothetical protein